MPGASPPACMTAIRLSAVGRLDGGVASESRRNALCISTNDVPRAAMASSKRFSAISVATLRVAATASTSGSECGRLARTPMTCASSLASPSTCSTAAWPIMDAIQRS